MIPKLFRISWVAMVVLLCATTASNAATYFTRVATGNWNTAASWSTVGFGGAAAGAFPVAGDIVNIGNGSVITTTANHTCAQLNINAGGTLRLGGFTFSVSGTTGVSGQLISITSATGTKTFTGAVTINAGGVWNLTAVNPATSFGAGITMSGTTFNNGTGATAFSASQSLLGANDMTFGGVMTPAAGTTLINSNTGTVTVSNSIALTGNFTQGNNAILNLTGATPFSGGGTFDASSNTNLVNYSGTAQTVKAVTYSNLTLSGSGAKNINGLTNINSNFTLAGTASATPNGDLTIVGNFTYGAGTTFVGGNNIHSIVGNWVNNGGTFTNANSSINFTGTTSTVGGTTSTTFNNVNVGGGTTTFSLQTTIAGIMNVDEGGAQAHFGGLTTHTANRMFLGRNGQSNGTYGGTGSGATWIYPTYFAASSGRITVGVTSTQSLPFSEPFTGEADGTTLNFSPPWNVTQAPSSGTFQKESPTILIGDDGFEINNTGATEGVWQTADLDIPAGVTEIAVSMDITALGTSAATDYVKILYVFDVGSSSSETLLTTVTATTSPVLFIPATGHTKFRLVIRGKDNTGGTFLGIPLDFTVDNINIVGMRNLYSRATAAWNASGTWSTVGINGADCACTPSAAGSDRVFIGGSRTVTLAGPSAAASVQVNGPADAGGVGTLNLSTQTLTVDLGGYITVNTGGSITSAAGSAISIDDSQPHTLTINGTATIGALSIDNNSLFTAMPVSVTGSGSFTVSGNVTETTALLGTPTLTFNMPATIGGQTDLALLTAATNNSTVTMTSTAADALTGFGTWTQNSNSTLNYAGSTISILFFNAAASGNTVDYNRSGAQTINNTTYWHLDLSNSGAKSLNGDIQVQGDWTRSGTATFNGSGDEVEFNAPATGAAQTITAPVGQTETFSDLRTNSSFATSPQIIFANNVTVSGELIMSQGNINLNSRTLTLSGDGGLTHSGATTAGWAYGGTITRNFDASALGIGTVDGLVPIGTSTSFRPFYFGKNNVGGSTGSVTVTHADAGTTTVVSVADTGPAATIIRRRDAAWNVTTAGGTGATFGIRYGGTDLGTVTSVAHLRSMLLNSVIATNVAGSGTNTNPRVERSALTPAQMTNNFYLGSTNAASSLPISLVSFDGVAKKYGVELSWKTESELNNDFFTVLHSTTGMNDFVSIGTVAGNGTTTEAHDYALIHRKPIIGKNYYMLRQTDYDGKASAQEAIVVEVTELGTFVSVYPNPLRQERVLNVTVGGLEPQGMTDIHVVDMRGITVRKLVGTADETGTIKASLDFSDAPLGLYILKTLDTQFKFAIE